MTTKETGNRVAWVDAAKGIGIILVVLGHIWLIGQGYTYINSFHVPLFFFLSGYVTHLENAGFQAFVAKKFKSIVVPYLWFSLLTFCYWVLVEKNISGNSTDPQLAFINIFLSPGGDQNMPHNPSLWFFTCLFIVSIMFYPIANMRKRISISITLLLFSVTGYFLSWYLPSYLPWSIDVALTGIVFYGMGFIFKNSTIVRNESMGIRLLLLFCGIVVGFLVSQLNGRVVMVHNNYGNYVFFYTAACLGILSVIILSVLLRENKVLLYLGRNSLIIFALHFPVKRLVVSVTSKALHVPLDQVKGSFLLSSVDTTITILILIPVIYVIHNYFPFILGKRYSSSLGRLPEKKASDMDRIDG